MSAIDRFDCILNKVYRSSSLEVFLGKGVLKICSKFTGEHPCRSAISKKLQSNFIEITLRHGCSPKNLLHIFRTPFSKNTSGRLLLSLIPWFNYVSKCLSFSSDNFSCCLSLKRFFGVCLEFVNVWSCVLLCRESFAKLYTVNEWSILVLLIMF